MLNRLFSRFFRSKAPDGRAAAAGLPPWLDGYAGQSTAQLIDLGETHRIDSVVSAFEAGIDQKAQRHGIESLTPSERVVLAVEAVEREVNNGGFDQLFRNSSKEHAPNFVSSLEAIGRPEVADLARRAIALLRSARDRSRSSRSSWHLPAIATCATTHSRSSTASITRLRATLRPHFSPISRPTPRK